MASRKQTHTASKPRGKSAKAAAQPAAKQKRDTLVALRAHVDDIEARLKKANALTRSSVNALKSSYKSLQARVGPDEDGSPEALTALIENLSARLNGSIEQTRRDIAHDLKIIIDDPRLETLSAALTKANQRLTRAEAQQSHTINTINEQIAALATAVDDRFRREVRERERVNAQLSQQIKAAEDNSARAVQTIGNKVVELTQGFAERAADDAEQLRKDMAGEFTEHRQELDAYKAELDRRIEAIEDVQRNTGPALERYLASLEQRVETIEINGPPAAQYDTEPAAAPPPFETAPDMDVDPAIEDAESQLQDAFSAHEPEQAYKVAPPPAPAPAMAAEAMPTPQYSAENVYDNPYAQTDYYAAHAYDQNYEQPQGAPQPYMPNQGPDQNGYYQMGSGGPQAPDGIAQHPARAQFNFETGAFEPPQGHDGGVMPLQPQDTLGAPQAIQTMDAARPGVDPKAKSKKRGKAKKSSAPVLDEGPRPSALKTGLLMTGIAVLGLFAAKTVLPRVMGPGEQAAPQTSANLNAGAPLASIDTGEMAQVEDIQNVRPVESIEPVGDYSAGMSAPDLGPSNEAAPSPQKLTLESAAADGNPVAQFQLGLSHLEAGRDAEAVRLIRLAANQNQPAAQYRLAKLYEAGIGLERDMQTAMGLLERAADGGNRIAMHDLGHYHATAAAGGTPDVAAAAQWFEKAANLGVLDSQFNLGVLYQEGTGVPQDLVQAYVWYAIAGGQGDQIAAQRAELIKRDMGPGQIELGDSKVRAFAPARINDPANGVFKNLPWSLPQTPAAARVNTSVKTAQELLSALGYPVGAPDGAMGPKTRNAIMSFERANGLPETGRVNAELLDRLNLAAGA